MLTKIHVRNRQNGFTLLELLVVICIIICLMALIWPQTRPIIEKKKQMRALNECRAINDALMMYTLFRGGSASPDNPVDLIDYQVLLTDPLSVPPNADLQQLLSPHFLSYVPTFDPWGNAWEVWVADQTNIAPLAPPHFNVNGPRVFLVRSLGSNGQDDPGTISTGGIGYEFGDFALNQNPTSPNPFGDDVVCADGAVVRWPGQWDFSGP